MARTVVNQLRQVLAEFKGLSVELLRENVDLDLHGIDWGIVGGESGRFAKPFDLAWARHLREQFSTQGAALFVKQLGANCVDGGNALVLKDSHGSEWDEWPRDLRTRELPKDFGEYRPIIGSGLSPDLRWEEVLPPSIKGLRQPPNTHFYFPIPSATSDVTKSSRFKYHRISCWFHFSLDLKASGSCS